MMKLPNPCTYPLYIMKLYVTLAPTPLHDETVRNPCTYPFIWWNYLTLPPAPLHDGTVCNPSTYSPFAVTLILQSRHDTFQANELIETGYTFLLLLPDPSDGNSSSAHLIQQSTLLARISPTPISLTAETAALFLKLTPGGSVTNSLVLNASSPWFSTTTMISRSVPLPMMCAAVILLQQPQINIVIR